MGEGINRISFTTLARKTSSNLFIKEIDGMRFIAIMMVMFFHLNTSMYDALGIGIKDKNIVELPFFIAWVFVRLDLGVKFFFTISGFILALQFFKRPGQIELRKYYLRRLKRLEPPYIISLLIFLVIHIGFIGEEVFDFILRFIAGCFYLHVPIWGYPNPINPVSWSLETEAQFYLLIPLLFKVINRLSRHAKLIFLAFLFMVGLLSRYVIAIYDIGHFSNSVLAHMSHFVVGIVLAWMFTSKRSLFSYKSYFFDALFCFALILMFLLYKPQHLMLNLLGFNFAVFVTVYSIFNSKLINWILTRKVIYILGGMCYSIYLIHYAFYHLLVPVFLSIFASQNMSVNLIYLSVTVIPITIIISGLYYVLLERPFMNG